MYNSLQEYLQEKMDAETDKHRQLKKLRNTVRNGSSSEIIDALNTLTKSGTDLSCASCDYLYQYIYCTPKLDPLVIMLMLNMKHPLDTNIFTLIQNKYFRSGRASDEDRLFLIEVLKREFKKRQH